MSSKKTRIAKSVKSKTSRSLWLWVTGEISQNLDWLQKAPWLKKESISDWKISETDELGLNPDNAAFWNCLQSMNDTIVENVPAPFSEETWLNHFQSLHSDDPGTSIQQREIYNELQTLEIENEQLNYLDHAITEQEISQAVKKLKNKKSPFVDKLRNKIIKVSPNSLMPVYIKPFNLILQSGKMPDIWCQGLITPIYKSGDKSDPTNYRGKEKRIITSISWVHQAKETFGQSR